MKHKNNLIKDLVFGIVQWQFCTSPELDVLLSLPQDGATAELGIKNWMRWVSDPYGASRTHDHCNLFFPCAGSLLKSPQLWRRPWVPIPSGALTRTTLCLSMSCFSSDNLCWRLGPHFYLSV